MDEQNEKDDLEKMEQITKNAAKDAARKTSKLAVKAIKKLIKTLIKAIGIKGFLIISAILVIVLIIPLFWYGVTQSTFEGLSGIISQSINGSNSNSGANSNDETNSNSETIGLVRSNSSCYYRRQKF